MNGTKAKAQIVADWGCAEAEYGGRGAPHGCSIPEPHKSIPDYTAVWAGLPPKSPVTVSRPLSRVATVCSTAIPIATC
jgi:hypothetical protein